MPKYTAFAAITLDGKIARKKNELSFNWTSKEDQKIFQAQLKKFDAVVVGRHTFQTAKARLLKRNTIVLTSLVKTAEETYPHVWMVNYKKVNLKKFIGSLKFNNIAILGGGKVYGYCLQNKLLDELYLTIEPIVFGKGINFFASFSPSPLQKGRAREGFKTFKLLSIKKLNKQGSILLRYIK